MTINSMGRTNFLLDQMDSQKTEDRSAKKASGLLEGNGFQRIAHLLGCHHQSVANSDPTGKVINSNF